MYPIYNRADRFHFAESLKCVDFVFAEESLEMKEQDIKMFDADILVMGDDWKGKFDHFSNVFDVHHFERTPLISTIEIIEVARNTKP